MPRDLSTLPEPVRLWVEALLSNKYTQGVGALKTINNKGAASFCCLGVYLDIAYPTDWKTPDDTNFVPHKFGDHKEMGGTQILNKTVWCDLVALIPPEKRDDWGNLTQARLTAMNDEGGSFAEIVDEIIIPAWSKPEAVTPTDFENSY